MTPLDWLNAAIIVAGIGFWTWLVLGVREWRDRYSDSTSGPRVKWSRWRHNKTDAIAKLNESTIWTAWLLGDFVIWWAVAQWPFITTGAASVVGVAKWLRHQDSKQPADIQALRTVLVDKTVMGPNAKGLPPKVTTEGDHPAGGPLRITIAAHPGFQDWEQAKQDKVERAIESRMPGDWENVEWLPTGASVWERLPELPDRVDYTHHFNTLPDGTRWPPLLLPDGVDGISEWPVTIDLSKVAHVMVAGLTRSGKTSRLRVWAGSLLYHGVEIAAIDVKGGLSCLRGRKGVRFVETVTLEAMDRGMAAIAREVQERIALYDATGRYRPPLVVMCDEFARACTWDAANKDKDHPTAFRYNAALVATLGGQVGVHLVLATQRPAADVIPIEVRDQCEWRVAVGPMSIEVAGMMFEREKMRAVNAKNRRGFATVGDYTGEASRWVQGFWMADPKDPDHDAAERALAEDLLPPRMVVRLSDTDVGFDELGTPQAEETLSKRGDSSDVRSDGSAAQPVVYDAMTDGSLLAIVAREKRQRAMAAARQRRYEARKRAKARAAMESAS